MNELELITLRVSPEDARKLATAAQVRANHFADKFDKDCSPDAEYDPHGWRRVSKEYRRLAAEVNRQRSLS